MPTVTISSIICELPQETDKDEIYLVFKGKKIWPRDQKYQKIDTDENLPINIKLKLNGKGWLKLELWEYDLTSKNDHLGTFHLKVDDSEGDFSEMLTNIDPNSEVSYFLNWQLKQDRAPEPIAE